MEWLKVGKIHNFWRVATEIFHSGFVDTPGPPVCVVSIVRSGDILQEAVRYLHPGVSVGKILVQRDESKPDKPAVLYYKKLPKNINESFVILVDPMLATAGSALRAISVLKVTRMHIVVAFKN